MRKYIEFKYSFEELKQKIDLVSFFQKQFPNYVYEKKKKGYTLRNTDGDLIDLFLFFNDSGIKKYWNPLNAHGGDLLSFIKNNDLVTSDGSDKGYYYNLNVLLHEYINELDIDFKPSIPEGIYNEKQTFFNYLEHTNNISSVNADENKSFVSDYLKHRQIDLKTLNNTVFKDKIFVLKQTNPSNEKEYIYLSSKIQRIDNGIPVGLTRKNKQFNGIERNSARGKGFFISNYDKSKTIKELYLFESWEDTLAYFELNKLKESDNNVFLATNGNYSEQQKKDIVDFIHKNNIKTLNLCNDNDIAGTLYNLSVISMLTKNIKIDFSLLRNTQNDAVTSNILIKSDVTFINTDKIDKEAFIKLTGNISTDYNKSEISEYKKFISEKFEKVKLENELIMITQNKENKSFRFYVPYKKKPIVLFNKYLIKTDNSQSLKLNMKIPKKNDFNEDLKAYKKNRLKSNKQKL